MNDLHAKLDFLIERWCAGRKLEPLRRLLNGKASINGMTDGWEELRRELMTIRARHASELASDEIDTLVAALHAVEDLLDRK